MIYHYLNVCLSLVFTLYAVYYCWNKKTGFIINLDYEQ